MEHEEGIEPSESAWKAEVLPLYDSCEWNISIIPYILFLVNQKCDFFCKKEKPFNSAFVEFVLRGADFEFDPSSMAGAGQYLPGENMNNSRALVGVGLDRQRSQEENIELKAMATAHEWLHSKFLGEQLGGLRDTQITGREDLHFAGSMHINIHFAETLLNLVGPEVLWLVAHAGGIAFENLWDYTFNNENNFKIVSYSDLQLAKAAQIPVEIALQGNDRIARLLLEQFH